MIGRTRLKSNAALIRHGALLGLPGPTLTLVFTLGTWLDHPDPLLLATATLLLFVNGLMGWRADLVSRWPARTAVRWAATLLNLVGLTLLSAQSGGVAGPLGMLLPVALLVFSLITPPRQFLVIAVAVGAGYWTVAVFGAPSSPGYAFVNTLAFGGISYLCFTHAGVLVSLRRRLATVSRTDPLTQRLNRRGFTDRLSADLADAARTGRPVTLILADLDGFKVINDTYGHQTGDDLLVWAGDTVAATVPATGAVGRLGGDEFAAVLVGTGPADAAVLVERLHAAMDGVAPASIGYACHPADGAGADELMHAADVRTYADKLARPAVPPTPEAVARARSEIGGRNTVRVSRHERRRRSITDMGWLMVLDFSIGLLYVIGFAWGTPHRTALLVLHVLGLLSGVVIIATAGLLSRTRSALKFMIASVLVTFPIGTSVAALDGGAGSALAAGLLIPMPLIALGTPARVAAPVLGVLTSLYLGLAVFGGSLGGWHVATSLITMLGTSVVCAVQGRAAAKRRNLLTRLSRVDALTELVNRRGFEERFDAALAEAARTLEPVSLLVLDLDGFKKVNDTHGHAAGDELLRWTAATLRANTREDDVVGRLGGDEFVVLLAATGPAGSRAKSEKLVAALAERTRTSVGTAVLGKHGEDFDSLYTYADAQLYAGKAGRRSHRPAPAVPAPAEQVPVSSSRPPH